VQENREIPANPLKSGGQHFFSSCTRHHPVPFMVWEI